MGSFYYTPCGIVHVLTFAAKWLMKQCKNKVCQQRSVYCASDQENVMVTWLICLGSCLALHWYTQQEFWFLHWHFTMDRHSSSGFALVQTAQSQHDLCPYTISRWIWFHLIFLISFLVDFAVGVLSYMHHVACCGEFLLHTQCYFMWGVSLTHPMLFDVGSFSYTPHAI